MLNGENNQKFIKVLKHVIDSENNKQAWKMFPFVFLEQKKANLPKTISLAFENKLLLITTEKKTKKKNPNIFCAEMFP